jgi:TetR/AcrR family transcriptional regulator, ethionamide resistance regulator
VRSVHETRGRVADVARRAPPRARSGRLRRRPGEAKGEILEAAERVLRRRPFRDLQVADLMDETGLRRSSFYHYFRDRHDLVVGLLEKLAAELVPMNEVWFRAEGDRVANLRAGYEGIGRFWDRHGPVLRAIADAATHDRKVERAHRRFVERFVRGTAGRIRADIECGQIAPLDAEETARALILMSERFLNEKLGRDHSADWRSVVDTLTTIWQRALYGRNR